MSSGSVEEFFASLRDLCTALSEVLDVLALALVVGAIGVAILFPVGGLVLAAGMLTVAAGMNEVSTGLRAGALGIGLGLAITGARVDGRRAVTWGEVFGDAVSVGTSAAFAELPGHGEIGGRGGQEFFSYASGRFGPASSEALARQIFLRDFTRTVFLPHAGRALEQDVVESQVDNVLHDLTDPLTLRAPEPTIVDRVEGVDGSDIVDSALAAGP
jgi:hypothetical protein